MAFLCWEISWIGYYFCAWVIISTLTDISSLYSWFTQLAGELLPIFAPFFSFSPTLTPFVWQFLPSFCHLLEEQSSTERVQKTVSFYQLWFYFHWSLNDTSLKSSLCVLDFCSWLCILQLHCSVFFTATEAVLFLSAPQKTSFSVLQSRRCWLVCVNCEYWLIFSSVLPAHDFRGELAPSIFFWRELFHRLLWSSLLISFWFRPLDFTSFAWFFACSIIFPVSFWLFLTLPFSSFTIIIVVFFTNAVSVLLFSSNLLLFCLI